MADVIKVHSFVYYLTEVEGISWRHEDYQTSKIVHAIKGDQINGYFEVTVGGRSRTFTRHNIGEFIPLMINTVANRLKAAVSGEFALVPIPNSNATATDRDEFPTLAFARGVVGAIGSRAIAVPALRWRRAKQSARKGGSRNPQALFENLVIVEKPEKPVVIFDDVITTGAQMIAASRRLEAAGAQLQCGIVIGRATKTQRPKMMGWAEEDVYIAEHPIY